MPTATPEEIKLDAIDAFIINVQEKLDSQSKLPLSQDEAKANIAKAERFISSDLTVLSASIDRSTCDIYKEKLEHIKASLEGCIVEHHMTLGDLLAVAQQRQASHVPRGSDAVAAMPGRSSLTFHAINQQFPRQDREQAQFAAGAAPSSQ